MFRICLKNVKAESYLKKKIPEAKQKKKCLKTLKKSVTPLADLITVLTIV